MFRREKRGLRSKGACSNSPLFSTIPLPGRGDGKLEWVGDGVRYLTISPQKKEHGADAGMGIQ